MTLQEHEYDGRGYRIVKKTYPGGTLNETRHYYYNNSWQDLEERLGTSTTPDRQFIWGLRYIDDLILRDRTTTSPLNERLYALQDGNWNVTSVVNTAGAVQERYEYDPYGNTTILTPTFGVRTTSDSDWETTYCGYRWDEEVGLFAVRNRCYSPLLGTWLTRDPIGYATGFNLITYVNGMPPEYIDPFGLRPDTLPSEVPLDWFRRVWTPLVDWVTTSPEEQQRITRLLCYMKWLQSILAYKQKNGDFSKLPGRYPCIPATANFNGNGAQVPDYAFETKYGKSGSQQLLLTIVKTTKDNITVGGPTTGGSASNLVGSLTPINWFTISRETWEYDDISVMATIIHETEHNLSGSGGHGSRNIPGHIRGQKPGTSLEDNMIELLNWPKAVSVGNNKSLGDVIEGLCKSGKTPDSFPEPGIPISAGSDTRCPVINEPFDRPWRFRP